MAWPVGLIAAMNPSLSPPEELCTAPAWGKSAEVVSPATTALPSPATAIASPESRPVPPRYVEYASAPSFNVILVTKASVPNPSADPGFDCAALRIGKSRDPVMPVTYALDDLSTAIASPKSSDVPPRYVE